MDEIKCIYCGKGESDGITLSVSDIIPDGLTNVKITNKNVCTIEHNNNFSDKFESYVINELAFVRNYLGIKNKDSKYPKYKASFEIQGDYYNMKIASDRGAIGNKIIKSETNDKKTLLGPLEKIKKVKKAERNNVTHVDLNKVDIFKHVEIPGEVFESQEMYRLIAKIAYELHCKKYNITGKDDRYIKIIDFIVNGTGTSQNIIEILKYTPLYELLNSQCEIGSHVIIEYADENNGLVMLVYLFGLIIYKVSFGPSILKENAFSYEEFTINGVHKEKNLLPLVQKNIGEILMQTDKAYNMNIQGVNVSCLEYNEDLSDIFDILFTQHTYDILQNINKNRENDEDLYNIFISNLRRMLNQIGISVLTIKRFIKEIRPDLNDKNKLLNCSNERHLFYLFILYIAGKSNVEEKNSECMPQIIKKGLDKYIKPNETLTSQIAEFMKKEMNEEKEFLKYVKMGIDLFK